MASLAERIREGREQWVTVQGREFLIRRPTRLQLVQYARSPSDLVFHCVVGWKLKELDVVPGGSGAVPQFDAEAFREWAEDEVEVLTDLAGKIDALIKAHAAQREALEKN